MSATALLAGLAARAPLGGALRDALHATLADGNARDTLFALAETQYLLGLVLVRLERDGLLHAASAGAQADARSRLSLLRRRAAAQDMERERMLAYLRRAGVDAVLLKGAALRVALYEEAVQRHTGDVDVLVAPEQLAPAMAALAGAGYVARQEGDEAVYARHHFHHGLRHPGGQVVEVHWALNEPGAPGRLDPAAVLARSRRHARRDGVPLLVPAWEHTVLHLALQNAAEPQRLASRCVDIDRIVSTRSIDWALLVAEARAAGARTPLWYSLRGARALFGADVPDGVLRALEPSATVRSHLDRLPLLLHVAAPLPAGDVQLFQLWMLLGDHPPSVALRWLLGHALVGPREREGRSSRRALGADVRRIAALARDQLQVYLRSAVSPDSRRPASRSG